MPLVDAGSAKFTRTLLAFSIILLRFETIVLHVNYLLGDFESPLSFPCYIVQSYQFNCANTHLGIS
jgi:hypothetical protein